MLKGTFSSKVKDSAKPHQVQQRHATYTLQQPFKKELERLQEQQVLASIGLYETAEWCNSFIIVPKPNGTVQLYFDPGRLKQALVWPVHRGPTWNDVLLKLTNACYMTIINASSGYHNLKLDKRSSYLTTFTYQFGWYRFTRLPFELVPAGDMFQWKINEVFKGLPNRICIAEGILIMGYDAESRDHDRTLRQVMLICHQETQN